MMPKVWMVVNGEKVAVSQPYSRHETWVTRLRFWLIRKLSGSTVVVINARVSVRDAADDRVGLEVNAKDALLVDNHWMNAQKVTYILSNAGVW